MNERLSTGPLPGVGLLGLGLVVLGSLAAGAEGMEPGLDPVVVAVLAFAVVAAVAAVFANPAYAFSAAIVAAMFSGHWGDMGSPLPLDRGLFAVGVGALLLRQPLRRPEIRRIPFTYVVIALAILVVVISAAVSGTITDRSDQFALLDRFGIVPMLSFVLAPFVFRTSGERRILLWTLSGAGLYLGVTALAESVGLDALVWPRYITDSGVGFHFGRARGPFAEAGAMGLGLWGCGVAAAVLASLVRSRGQRLFLGFIIALCAVGLLLTETRAVWLGAVVTVAVVILVSRELWRFALPATLVGIVLVVGALALVPGLAADVSARRGEQGPVWDRLNSNRASLNMLADKPLFGHGWGTYNEAAGPYYRLSDDYPIRQVGEVHNVLLSNLAEIGLVGTSLWLLALLLAVGGGLRPFRGPPEQRAFQIGLVAIAVNWAVSAQFTPLSYLLPNLLLWTWAGVTWAVLRERRG